MIGKTLDHYEIAVPLVRGSMGVAYQAKGRKPGRDVTAKVSPEKFVGILTRIRENEYRHELAGRRRDAFTMSEE